MSVRLVLDCPHCRREFAVQLGYVEVRAAAAAPAAPAAKPSKSACGCGHERARHEDGSGKCLHGQGTAFGGCECTAYHVKKRARAPKLVLGKTTRGAVDGSPPLNKCALAVLRVLVQRMHTPTSRAQAAILSGYSVDSGGFAAALAALRAGNFVADSPTGMIATDVGRHALAEAGRLPPELPKGPALITYWAERLGPCPGAILQRLATAYPDEIPREDLAAETGYSAASGGFAAALARLRTLELVDGLRASHALMSSAR